MRTSGHVAIVCLALLVSSISAQTPATPQAPASPKPPATTPQRRPPVRPRTTQLVVRDVSGTPIEGVRVIISAPASRSITTDEKGSASVSLADGSYRLRFEHEGFVTLEREITIRIGQPAEIDVALSAAPRLPAPPPPQPVAPPPKPVPPPPPPVASGPPTNLSIPAFLDKNFIGGDPLKESILGCTQDGTTRLLQLRDPLAEHAHTDLDEVLYVVAGEGAVRIRDESTAVTPGWLTIIPRGLPHAIERRGRRPLIVLSMLSGAPCRAALRPPSGK